MPRYFILLFLLIFSVKLFTQNNIYTAYKDSGNAALVDENYQLALNYYKIAEKDTSLAAIVNFNMGIAYQTLTDYENALKCYINALNLYKGAKKKAAVLNSLGILYKNVKNYKKSIELFENALLYNNKSMYLINLSNALLLNGQIDSAYYYLNKGNLGQSEETVFKNNVSFAWNLYMIEAEEAFDIILTLTPKDNFDYLDRYYFILGCYYQSIDEYSKALRFFNKGLDVCSNKLVKIYLLGELKRHQEALIIIDSLLASSENYSTKLHLAAKQSHFYDQLILDALKKNNTDSAFYFTEKSKSVALKAHLSDKGLIERVRIKDIRDIQKDLRKKEVLFEYKIIDSLLICFEITPVSFKHYSTTVAPYFFTAIYDVNEVCKDVDYPIPNPMQRYCSGAHYLFNIFLGGKNIDGKNLVIVPDGRFFNLAFDVLLTSPGDTNDYKFMHMPYLIRQNTIRYVYTASMNRTVQYNKLEILHIAPPVELSGAVELKGAIKKYSRFYDKFTKDGLKSEMKKYAFLHFDTHGYINEEHPLNSSLELGFDSLFVSEIIKEDLSNTDMVFLAACNTGVGKYSKGEGTVSIERGFMLAGAKTVVTAFWFASDLFSPRILSVYYRELKKGDCPEDAMRTAKLEFLAAPPKVNVLGYHPYNWATYSVVGASGTVHHKTKKPVIVLSGLLSAFILLLFLVYREKL